MDDALISRTGYQTLDDLGLSELLQSEPFSMKQGVSLFKEYSQQGVKLKFIQDFHNGRYRFYNISPLLNAYDSRSRRAQALSVISDKDLTCILNGLEESVRYRLPSEHQTPQKVTQALLLMNSSNNFWYERRHYFMQVALSEKILQYICINSDIEHTIFFLRKKISYNEAEKMIDVPVTFLQKMYGF